MSRRYAHPTMFIVMIGIVSLFSDMTYEGARSVTGPFLRLLGASATVVGIVAGVGELVGYALRLLSGYLADKTKRYWTLTMVGYAVNLLAVPLLALTTGWLSASFLIVLERFGKALRTPSRDAMLSYATSEIGRGWGFGLHEAMDQLGAMAGPIFVSVILTSFHGTYRDAFSALLIPVVAALAMLTVARLAYPTPEALESTTPPLDPAQIKGNYRRYLIAMACVAAGYADFPLIAYHFQHHVALPTHWIPLSYAIAMGTDAIAALCLGRLFDRQGDTAILIPLILSLFFPPLVFFGGFHAIVGGMILWGIGMGAQESIMRAAITRMVEKERRATAYGIFNTVFGIAWFGGSALMGILYDVSPLALVGFSVALQLVAIPIVWRLRTSL